VLAVAAFVSLRLEPACAQDVPVSESGHGLRQFHIAAGNAQITLNEFSRQAGLQLLYDFTAVAGIRTREVSGEMEPAVALRRMIDGTPLTFEFVNGGTVTVIRDGSLSNSKKSGR
jgi:hypothetical protein